MRSELEDVLELYEGMPPEGQRHWVERALPSVEFDSQAERTEFLEALHERDKKPSDKPAAAAPSASGGPSLEFRQGQRVKANLAGITAGGVQFSQNVEAAYATIHSRVSDSPPIYRLKLLISFHGVTEADVPAERIRPM